MERSLRVNILAGFFGMFWLSVPLGVPLPLLMQELQASSTQLGALSASWQIAMLAQIPAALLAERLRRRKFFWASASVVHRILWAAPAAVPVLFPEMRERWPVAIIVALSASNLLANLGTASWQSWMADLVPEKSAGIFWGIRQRFLSLGLILATAGYGWILDKYSGAGVLAGFQWVFALCAFFGVCDILVHLGVREPLPARPEEGNSLMESIGGPFRRREFRMLTAAMAFWISAQSVLGYTLGMPGFFSMVHLKETFGASFSQASCVFLCNALGAVLFTPLLGRWMDRSGAVPVLLRLLALAPVSQMGWWLAPGGSLTLWGTVLPRAVLWMLPVSLIQGALMTGALLCQFRLTQMFTSARGRTVSMALHWSIAGIGGAAGSILAGVLQDQWHSGSAGREGLIPGWTAFDALVLVQALLTWLGALPLLRACLTPGSARPEPASTLARG